MTDSGPLIVNFLTGIYAGDTRDLVFTVYAAGTTQAQVTAGTAVPRNITGFTFEWAMKHQDDDTAQLSSLTTANPAEVELSDAVNGEVTVHLPRSVTAANPGRHRHALRRTNSGNESVGAIGDIVIHPAPTGTG